MYDRKASEFGVRPSLTDDQRKDKYPKDAVHPVVRTHPSLAANASMFAKAIQHRFSTFRKQRTENSWTSCLRR
jgi:alpha-ketoglutarate-dependent taurine dioxygenase